MKTKKYFSPQMQIVLISTGDICSMSSGKLFTVEDEAYGDDSNKTSWADLLWE